MRHGPAEDHAESGRDYDRALTASGRARCRDVAQALMDDGEAPSFIVTSPLVRTVQTAEIVAATTELAKRGGVVETNHDLAPGGNALRVVAELTKRRDDKGNELGRVLVCGHEPDLSSLVGILTGDSMPAGMMKAMVVGVRVPREQNGQAGSATRRFTLDPKTLRFDRA